MEPAKLKAFILCFCLLTGCTTAKIESNVRPGYTKKINTVYSIFSTSVPRSTDFLKELKIILVSKFESRGIKANIHIYDNLALDEKQKISTEVQTFNPGYILELSQTSLTRTNGEYSGGTFELSLYESGHEEIIWKAVLTTTHSVISATGAGGRTWGGGVGSPEKTADIIIGRLANDGLISPSPKMN